MHWYSEWDWLWEKYTAVIQLSISFSGHSDWVSYLNASQSVNHNDRRWFRFLVLCLHDRSYSRSEQSLRTSWKELDIQGIARSFPWEFNNFYLREFEPHYFSRFQLCTVWLWDFSPLHQCSIPSFNHISSILLSLSKTRSVNRNAIFGSRESYYLGWCGQRN